MILGTKYIFLSILVGRTKKHCKLIRHKRYPYTVIKRNTFYGVKYLDETLFI